jgi:Protein of unknown function (DUF3293)
MDERTARTEDYVRAILRVPDLGLALRPRPPGTVRGTFPFDEPAHVVTAYNPGAERPGDAENAARQARLEADLDARGVRRWTTVASAEDGSSAEVGALVVGLDDAVACAIGATWGQDAVFRWSPSAWTVLACDDAASVDLGWEIV